MITRISENCKRILSFMANSILTGNLELIRDINTQSVIRTIIENGPISRAAIAAHLGLTKATISAIVQVLLDRNLILEIGSDDTKKGRKPVLLQFNKDCGYIISMDLSTDTITLLTANLLGENCSIRQYPAPKEDSAMISFLIHCIQETADQLPDSDYGLLGIALSIHGVVHHNKIVFLPYSSYENIDLITPLEEHFHVPVLMENEANLSVLGEWAHCHNTNEMLYVSIHSGIGVGIIMRNQLVKGKNGYAGEFGHTIIEMDGRPCPCGNHGCLEQYASERALFMELSSIKKIPVNTEVFGQLYQNGDPDALRLMKSFIKYISIGINNLLNTFNPDIVVLNSSLNMYHPMLCDDIMDHLHNKMKKYCHLVPSSLQDTAALLGGVWLIHNQFLYPNQL